MEQPADLREAKPKHSLLVSQSWLSDFGLEKNCAGVKPSETDMSSLK